MSLTQNSDYHTFQVDVSGNTIFGRSKKTQRAVSDLLPTPLDLLGTE